VRPRESGDPGVRGREFLGLHIQSLISNLGPRFRGDERRVVAGPQPISRAGHDMNALERLGSYVAASGREHPSDAARELVELHLIDAGGALIATAPPVE